MPSYRLPSVGAYLLCLRPLTLRTTRTGFPERQSLASAPLRSLMGALQLRASALQGKWGVTCYRLECIPQKERAF